MTISNLQTSTDQALSAQLPSFARKAIKPLSSLAIAAGALVGPILQSAIVTQEVSLDAGINWNQATSGGDFIWSDGLAASGTNDYVNAGFTLRTTTSSSTFNGKSLTIQAGGQLLLKPNSANRVYTINDLILDGGTITHGQPSITNSYIAGSITLLSDSTYNATGSSYRRATISASITGSSVFNVILGGSDALTISSSFNSFDGVWDVEQYLSEIPVGFFATGDGSLGNASVSIDTGINFDVDYDIYNPTKYLSMSGIMTLDQDHTFGSIDIGGSALAVGTYSFAELNSTYDSYFADGGSGSLTVVPEPSYFFMALFALGIVGFARRSRK